MRHQTGFGEDIHHQRGSAAPEQQNPISQHTSPPRWRETSLVFGSVLPRTLELLEEALQLSHPFFGSLPPLLLGLRLRSAIRR
ncbi:MAG: hypothetical protein HC884_12435, partial [Chloroflexaceae bacterium]|nr:hypothetical protein [Chloroflexaceae bacterium]